MLKMLRRRRPDLARLVDSMPSSKAGASMLAEALEAAYDAFLRGQGLEGAYQAFIDALSTGASGASASQRRV